MKILFVLEHYYPHVGGVETLFLSLANTLANKGNEVTVITSKEPGTKTSEVINKVTIKRVSTPPLFRRYFFTILAIPISIKEAINCDLIHTTTYNAALPAWIASKVTSKPCLITVHEVLDTLWFQLRLPYISKCCHYLFERLVISLPFERYITVSNFTKKKLIQIFPQKEANTVRIYNGVDYGFWKKHTKLNRRIILERYGLEPHKNYFIYFGRPGLTKGVDWLIKAAPRVIKHLPDFHLVLVLSSEPASQFKEMLELVKHQTNAAVTIIPSIQREQLKLLVQSVKGVIVPSLSEGFGFTAVESRALSVPVIARKAGSLPEVLGNNLLFNTSDELIRKIELVIKHKGNNTKKYFPIEESTMEYNKLYKEVLNDQ